MGFGIGQLPDSLSTGVMLGGGGLFTSGRGLQEELGSLSDPNREISTIQEP